jgi:hypothetical protein
VKCAFVPALAKAGVLEIVRKVGGGFVEVDFSKCKDRIQPMLDQAVAEAPAKVETEVEKQRARNRKIEAVVERQEREGLAAASRAGSEVRSELVSEAQHLENLRAALRLRPVDMSKRARAIELDKLTEAAK